MAHDDAWTAPYEAEPADSDNAGQGDNEFRKLKKAIRQRMAYDHAWLDAASTTNDGKHKKLTFTKQTIVGALATDETTIWLEDDDESNTQLHMEWDAGSEFIWAMYDPTTALTGLITQFENTVHVKALAGTATPVDMNDADIRHYSYFSLSADGTDDREFDLMTTGVIQGRIIMLANDDDTDRVLIKSEDSSTTVG
ncbi:hypothetical protein LCGC14_2035070, partial [marine sediment metagenome]